jgi:hypothetical protein
MMTAYRATPEQWQQIIDAVNISRDSPNVIITPETSCIFELRSRIEKLESTADIHASAFKELRNSLLPDPRRSLIQRVHSCIVGEPECGHMQARAVIREVANWMREQEGDYSMIQWLEMEIDD